MISFQLTKHKFIAVYCIYFACRTREKIIAMVAAADFNKENILGCLETKMNLIFEYFKGKKKQVIGRVFREKKIVKSGFEREKGRDVSICVLLSEDRFKYHNILHF